MKRLEKNSADVSDNGKKDQEGIMKRTIKDSVFTDLFQDKKYLLQLYKALHPEDTDVTEDDLNDITIKNVLTDNIYNDLGFTVGGKLMILVEAQSSVWTVNIIVRALMYLVQTWHDYFERTKQNLYKSKKVQMPIPEVYVIFTGERKTRPSEISLSQEFFGGKECAVDVKVKMIYDGKEGDIINQYVMFTKVCNEQMKKYGRTRKAVMEAIRICKDRNVLSEYLSSKESEVVSIMMVLYDEEEIMRSYVESEVYEATQKAQYNEKIETAKRMLNDGVLPLDKVAEFSNLPLEVIERLANELQPV
ncbi:hypothetical protein [Sporofaciens musculi]|uniref:hypothetical protein n=1 Tax=Sporofaciens musculi TaxID=2681861 RepID=UPI002ECFB86E